MNAETIHGSAAPASVMTCLGIVMSTQGSGLGFRQVVMVSRGVTVEGTEQIPVKGRWGGAVCERWGVRVRELAHTRIRWHASLRCHSPGSFTSRSSPVFYHPYPLARSSQEHGPRRGRRTDLRLRLLSFYTHSEL